MINGITNCRYFLAGGALEVIILGKPHDWSLAKVQTQEDASKNEELLSRIGNICYCSGASDIFAPNPSEFNAVVLSGKETDGDVRAEFPAKIDLGQGMVLHRGAKADGCALLPRQAFFLASADCPTGILHDAESGMTRAFHAGRECLWDRKYHLEGKEPRTHESVVDAAMPYSTVLNNPIAYIVGGIGPESLSHPWTHPTHGDTNKKMVEYFKKYMNAVVGNPEEGMLDLTAVIKCQLISRRMIFAKSTNIWSDTIDTYKDHGEAGHLWWSHRRSVILKDGDEKKRNGVLVIRHR